MSSCVSAISSHAGQPAAQHTTAPTRPRLRVLLLVESSGGGTGRHVMDLTDGLLARECEVHLIFSTRRIDHSFSAWLSARSLLPRMALPMPTNIHPRDVGALWAIRRYIQRHGPFDVIHGHSSKGGALARLASVFTRTVVFYTMHGLVVMNPGLARWPRMIYSWIEVLLSLRTQRIIAVSPEEARAALRLGLGRRRVISIANGIADFSLRSRAAGRAELGVGPNDLVIGFVGRLVAQKAPDLLIRAFASVAGTMSHARLAIVGYGPLRAELESLANELGVSARLIWIGERDAREFFAAFDLFAITSRWEGLPYVVLEAMAAALPIVATASAGIESLVSDGINGRVTQPYSATAFADALLSAASDREFLSRAGRASSARASQFTADAMVGHTLSAYLDAVGAWSNASPLSLRRVDPIEDSPTGR